MVERPDSGPYLRKVSITTSLFHLGEEDDEAIAKVQTELRDFAEVRRNYIRWNLRQECDKAMIISPNGLCQLRCLPSGATDVDSATKVLLVSPEEKIWKPKKR